MLRYAIRCLKTTNVLLFLDLASLELTATLKFTEERRVFFPTFLIVLTWLGLMCKEFGLILIGRIKGVV